MNLMVPFFTEETGEEGGSNQPQQLATSNSNNNNNNKRVEENKDATVDASNLPKGINRLSRECILLMNRTTHRKSFTFGLTYLVCVNSLGHNFFLTNNMILKDEILIKQ
jgi:hypothetical protein